MCKRKGMLIIMAMLLLFQAAPSYAQTGFQDVSASDKYYEDISPDTPIIGKSKVIWCWMDYPPSQC